MKVRKYNKYVMYVFTSLKHVARTIKKSKKIFQLYQTTLWWSLCICISAVNLFVVVRSRERSQIARDFIHRMALLLAELARSSCFLTLDICL